MPPMLHVFPRPLAERPRVAPRCETASATTLRGRLRADTGLEPVLEIEEVGPMQPGRSRSCRPAVGDIYQSMPAIWSKSRSACQETRYPRRTSPYPRPHLFRT